MGIIYHKQAVVLLADRNVFGKFGQITILRVNSVNNDKTSLIFIFFFIKNHIQILNIIVPYVLSVCSNQSTHRASMDIRINIGNVILTKYRTKQAGICSKSRREKNCIFLTDKVSNFFFQLSMDIQISSNWLGSTSPCSIFHKRIYAGFNSFFTL